MNINYTWKITALKKAPSLDGLSDVITHIRFDYTGTDADSGEFHVFHGACPVDAPNPDEFTDIGSLTEEQVIAWAQANHSTENMNEVIERGILDKITPKNVPVTELGWLTDGDVAEAQSTDNQTEEPPLE